MQTNAMTAIARFVNVRAPQDVKDMDFQRLDMFGAPSSFESKLVEGVAEGKIQDSDHMREVAKALVEETSDQLTPLDIDDAVRAALMPRAQNANAASNIIKARLGKPPKQLLASRQFLKAWHDGWERYYGLSVLGKERRELANQLRAIEVLNRLQGMKPSEKTPTWTDALTWRLKVPKVLFQPQRARERGKDEAAEEMLRDVRKLHDEMSVIDAIKKRARSHDAYYYKKGDGAKLEVQIIKQPPGKAVPLAVQIEGAVMQDRLSQRSELKALSGRLSQRIGEIKGANLEGEVDVEPQNWLVKEIALPANKSIFSAKEHGYLQEQRHVALKNPELGALDEISNDLYKRVKTLLVDPDRAVPEMVAKAPETKALTKGMKLPKSKYGSRGFATAAASMPRVHVLGVGDLVVIEEQINRYEMGEVAHIENVMATETRSRKHVRTSETETTSTSEVEETAVDEKSLQTTNRFELTKETESQIESSLEITAGASVTAGYGPVSVTANAGITSSTSASSGKSTASTLSREAVEKAVSTVTKRVREEQIIRVLNRIEETNEHGFANTTDSHICGIYRWVDKYINVRAVNYGRRLMLEMIVPEPANGLLYAQDMHSDEVVFAEPPVLNIGPDDVSRYNYLDHAETYGAVDIPSPPKQVIYQTLNYGNQSGGDQKQFADTGKSMVIPQGYETTNVWRGGYYIHYDDYKRHHLAGSKTVPGSDSVLTGVVGSLQLGSVTECVAYMAGWKVRCELLDEAYDAWRVTAWAALKQAAEAAQAAYEERVAAHAIGQGVHIEGRNPDHNKEIMRNELKRAAVKYLSEDMGELIVDGTVRTNEVFDAADATGDFDLDEARIEGKIIQFFEQAFEWHNMTWLLYPYMWAHSSRQHHKLLAEDPDPAMREFLGSGAARVVVPVPVAYEDAVLNYFETNEIWNGGDSPIVDDPQYVSIAEELKQGRTNSFNSPIYYESASTPPPFIIDEWEVKLPTSLVKLQADDVLPTFPVGLGETDPSVLLDAAVQTTGKGAGWRNSIIDLLTLFGVANGQNEAVRRSFAEDNGYTGDADTDVIASIDNWSYFYVMSSISLNGMP